MGLSIAYTSQALVQYNVTFNDFTGQDISRTYQSVSGYNRSASGTQVLTGPPTRAKYVWAVSASLPKSDALIVDELFRAWDLDRSTGLNPAVGILDQNFGPDISGTAVITTPPTFTYVSEHFVIVALGLTEV